VEVLRSEIDASVNFVDWQDDDGAFEARYVRRQDDYFIAYLSSHTGCRNACRFCHLTATGQTMMRAATIDDYRDQVDAVMNHYRSLQHPAERVNFNFMSRGEAFDNPAVTSKWRWLEQMLREEADYARVPQIKCNLSTIFPKAAADVDLVGQFGSSDTAMIYYSLYSLNPKFRKRWLPKALEPRTALIKLARYQQKVGRDIALHWAFIEGENDDEQTIMDIIDVVNSIGLKAKFNLVRYNPYSAAQGREPSDEVIQRNFDWMAEGLGHSKSRIVPRVGTDVYASCGMFVK